MGSACFGCEPRNHPITGAGSDPSGRVLAVTWSSTMPGGDGDDDVWVVISRDSGETFGERLRVNDNETRSRQFQSWAAVDAAGTTHVIWTDLRNNGENATYYAYMAEARIASARTSRSATLGASQSTSWGTTRVSPSPGLTS